MFSLLHFFFYQGFLHRYWRITGQQGKWGDHLLFHSTISTCSQALKHIFATLYVTWLSRIFNRNACVYQTAMRYTTLSNHYLSDWLMMQCFFLYLMNWILGFCYSDLTLENGGFELASTNTLALQVNRLTKCASHAMYW